MRKILVFDVDRSLASVGGPEQQRETFGVQPVAVSGGVDEVMGYLKQLLAKEECFETHELFGQMPVGTRLVFNERAKKMGLTGIAIDSFSHLCGQTKEAIMRSRDVDQMDKQLWGRFGDKVMRFVSLLNQLSIPIVCTCHVAREQDENGSPIDLPAIQGSSDEKLAQFFSVVVYARVERTSKEHVRYYWQTQADTRRIYAKSRGGVLEMNMDQNLGAVFDAYEAKGIRDTKILVIGDSGQGKSTCLRTINSHSQTNPAPQPSKNGKQQVEAA